MRLTFNTPHHLSKLHDELLAAGFVPRLVEGDGASVSLEFDSAVDEGAVGAVVDAHDPTPPALPLSPVERIAALEAEVQGILDRTAATVVSDPDAAKVRDAVAGVQ